MKLPSKELLSEVCKTASKEKYNFLEVRRDGNNILAKFYIKEPVGKTFDYVINIYELAHKCKEWAKLKHFIDIDSHPGCARWGEKAVSHNGKPSVFYEQVFIGRTEPEAIFKACEYIMEQTKCGS